MLKSFGTFDVTHAVTRLIANTIRCLPLLGATAMLSGCARSPAFNVLGSYFPGWIVCMAVSVLLTALLRWGIRRIGLEPRLPMLPLLYFSLAIGIASTLWLLAFE